MLKRDRVHRDSRLNPMKSLDDQPLPRLKAFFDEPITPTPTCGVHFTHFDFIVRSDHIHKGAFRTLLNRTLRNQNRIGPDIALQPDADELSGIQIGLTGGKIGLRIGKGKTSLQGTRLRPDGHIGKIQLSFVGIDTAIRERHDSA